jgi:cyanobactin cluster PatC/TenC/TruC protein
MMATNDETREAPDATWTLAEPHEGGEHLHATGLEDYGYWLRWKDSLPPQGTGNATTTAKPFRRGVIWR